MVKFPGFSAYNKNKEYSEKYYQLQKVLLHGNQYKGLKTQDCIAYAVLKERLNYSIKNNWVDEDGDIYFVFTNVKLAEILKVSTKTVTQIKKNLENHGLLKQVPQPSRAVFRQGKWKLENIPNRLYLGNLEVTAEDVYIIDQIENEPLSEYANVNSTGRKKFPVREKDRNSTESTEGKNIPYRKNGSPLNDNSGQEKNSPYRSYTSSFDTKDTKVIDTESDRQLERDLLNDLHKTLTLNFFLPETIQFIARVSRDLNDAREMIKIIYKAKKTVEKNRMKYDKLSKIDYPFDYGIIGENFQNDLDIMIHRFVTQEKINRNADKPFKSKHGYLYSAAVNFWECCMYVQDNDWFEGGLQENQEHDLLTWKKLMKKDGVTKQAIEKEIYMRKEKSSTVLFHEWLNNGGEEFEAE